MAKAKPATKTKTAKKPAKKSEPAKLTKSEPLDPKRAHEFLDIHGPYEPPPPPIATKGYMTWWDPGCSIQTILKKRPDLFYLKEFSDRFAKDTDSWKWRQWRLEPIEPNLPFEEQKKKLKTGDEPAMARELVTFLTLHFLVTGERLDLGRLRCKDVLPSGQRMTVWFSPMGFDLATVPDHWHSPGIGLSVMCTPVVRKK
jgi:hypothetical protein